MLAEKIELDDGYVIEVHYDEDASNPFTEFDAQPTLVLHEKAERHFGWTNDTEWAAKLENALEEIAQRGYTRNLHGARGALAVVARWMRAFHGIRVVLPVSALEHSGTYAYLGEGSHWTDPGGWDSGWVGWLFAKPEAVKEWWGVETPTDEKLTESLKASFSSFAAWVEGAVYGYVVTDPDGEHVGSCWGFYGTESTEPGGYMYSEALSEVESSRADRRQDETEIEEARLAEVGG